ncbi:MAG TPA: carbamoyl-phosphate synthase large subunit, partial [Candidatus Gracilibacteria bacterium]|nr:carbamoyl-phosphate synthase large subunit [Candidatus Gracilibacteria bacterium]
HVAAKLALGYTLPEIRNAVTKTTTACFEPALDYLALKIPRWDLDKFRKVSHKISSEMKSVGEIMSLGRSFEEVMQKGLRMLQIGLYGFVANENLADDPKAKSAEKLAEDIHSPTPRRILAVAEALRKGWSLEKIHKLSGIDEWFLAKLQNVVKMEKKLAKLDKVDEETMRQAKKYGFSDKQISILTGKSELQVRANRKKMGIMPVVKQIDTLAAEYPAKTNYLYMTYHGDENDIDFSASKKKKMLVLGSGPYAIGTSVEFDWCCVNALKTAGKAGYEKIIINYNPETVSTDYDMSDKLYFDELSFERVMDICEMENPKGVIVSMGGQVPNNLALKLADAGVKLVGTSAKNIDRAESRHKFSALCDRLGIDQPRWQELSSVDDVTKFADEVGYPVLVRPSYVLSGAAMAVAHTEEALTTFLAKASRISTEAPVVVSKFEQGAKEIEIDAVAMKGEVLIYAIAEHIENAGVHSGDATIVLPPQKLYIETIRRVKQIAKKIAKELEI